MTTPYKQPKLLGFGPDGERKESVAFTNELPATDTQGMKTEDAGSDEDGSLATRDMLIIEDKGNDMHFDISDYWQNQVFLSDSQHFYDKQNRKMFTTLSNKVSTHEEGRDFTMDSEILQQNTWVDFWERKDHANYSLLQAVRDGIYTKTEELLDQSRPVEDQAEVFFSNEQGCNAFHIAIINDRRELVHMLLKMEPSLLSTPALVDERFMPLHLAVIQQLPIITKILVEEYEADPDVEDSEGNSALHLAVQGDMVSIVNTLLEVKPQSFFKQNHEGMLPIDLAACEKIANKLESYRQEQILSNKTAAAGSGKTFAHSSNEGIDSSGREHKAHHSTLMPVESRYSIRQVSHRDEEEAAQSGLAQHRSDLGGDGIQNLANIVEAGEDLDDLPELSDEEERERQAELKLKEKLAKLRSLELTFDEELEGETSIKKVAQEDFDEPIAQNIDDVDDLEFADYRKSDDFSAVPMKTVTDPENFIVNNYRILNFIGEGAFGQVLLCEHIHTGKQYALKILQKAHIDKLNILKFARSEKSILEKVTGHPYIIELKESFQNEKNLFLVLEYCACGTMQRVLKKQRAGRFTELQARVYISQIALAIDHLHKKSILYRDLKPENVLLGDDGYIKLTDFGLSKEISGDFYDSNSFCGSHAYLAPEMLQNLTHGRSIDWYGLGAMLYEFIIGCPPYFALDQDRLYKNITEQPLNIPDGAFSPECEDLVRQLLERNPLKRLGASTGFAELAEHPWFASVDWEDVRCKRIYPKQYKAKELKNKRDRIDIADLVVTKEEAIKIKYQDEDLKDVPKWSFYH